MTMSDVVLEHYNYWVVIVLMMIGMFTVISRGHLLKKVIGLNTVSYTHLTLPTILLV